MIASGESIKTVSQYLGHADITIPLRVYAHLMPNDGAKLAARADANFGGWLSTGCQTARAANETA